jgi:hypothetical protein
MEIIVESNNDRLQDMEEKFKMLLERIMKLELEQHSRYEEIKKVVPPIFLVGSYELDQMVAMEEDIVQQGAE